VTEWVAALREATRAEEHAAIALRHELHRHPDLSGNEQATADRIRNALPDVDCQPVAGTGLLARIGRQDGPSIAVRAELDALPVVEATGVPWSSDGPRMHACGHDVHLAALTAICWALQRTPIPAPALLAVFQPREESIPSGALDIVSTPEWAAHDVRAVIGAHVQPLLPARAVAATPGAINAAVCDFHITITGSGGHAAYPHATQDPVLALAEVIVSLQQAVSRRISPTSASVLSTGILQAGSAPGVIPASAYAAGTLRALDPDDMQILRTATEEVAEHVARAHRCQASVSFDQGEPVLVNDEQLALRARDVLTSFGTDLAPDLRSCGADDFAYFAQRYPSLMMFVGVDGGKATSLHQAAFYPAEEAVLDVADALLGGFAAACQLIESP
jgi:amidohydrolase